MSSDVYSSRQSSPIDVHQDAEMHEVGVDTQPEPETVPETPQATADSQPRHPSPPPPAQPPRPRSPLPSSSNPQVQNAPTSPGSIHTSVQAVSGSQLPSFEKPPVWARSDDEPSNGPSFELPGSQLDDQLAVVSKPTSGTDPSPEKQAKKPPSPVEEPTSSATTKPPQEKPTAAKKISRIPAFGESVFQAIELAFQQMDPGEAAPTTHDPSTVLPTPQVNVAQLPPPKPRSKPPSKVTQKLLPGSSPSPLDRLPETGHSESPVRHPFQALNRKVPVPEVGPTREPVRGRNENGVPTMVLIPASDDTKLSSPLKQTSSSQPVQSSQSILSSQPIPPSKHLPPSQTFPSSGPQIQHSAPQSDKSIAQEGDSIVVQVNETVADIEKIQDPTVNTQSSLEYASTQGEDKVAVDVGPSKLVDQLANAVVAKEGVVDGPLKSPLPQIVAIHEVESQQSVAVENEEEIDELEDDPELGGNNPVIKRKSKPALKPPSKSTKRTKLNKPPKSASSKVQSKPSPRADSVIEKVPSRLTSKLPPKPVVVIERKRAPIVPADERASTAQKRRLATPSEEGFPAPQPIKRSRVHGHRPAQTTLSPIPRTPPLPREGQSPVVSSVSRSAKGKERAEGIKGLEKISVSGEVAREEPKDVQAQAKKKAPDTGSKRKPSDAFSAQDVSRDVKRQKVAGEPEPRKLAKQLSFVDPDKLKQPFRSKPQVHKAPAQHGTTATSGPSTESRPEKGERTSKYFDPQHYREPEYPRITTTPEAELPQKVVSTKSNARRKQATHENGGNSGDLRPRIDSRKTGTSNSDRQLTGEMQKTSRVSDDDSRPAALIRAHHPKSGKEMERDWAAAEPQYPPARKLGPFILDLNPPFLPGLPGGRLMNKQLREILIRTGKVRVREAKAAESNQNGR